MICPWCNQDASVCQHHLPDAKPRERRGTVRSPFGELERIYCVNCGNPGGVVTPGTPIFYLCDGCAEQHGRLPLPEVEPTSPFYPSGVPTCPTTTT